MGTTIHFTGQLLDEQALSAVESSGRMFASARQWPFKSIDHTESDGVEYTGTVYYPHVNCEPVYLVFNDELRLDDFVKTQFAPSSVHVEIVELLRTVAPQFSSLEIHDEGDYWESSDLSALEECRNVIDSRLAEILAESPGSVRFVKESNGRIVDVYRARTPEAARVLAEAFGTQGTEAKSSKRAWWQRLLRRA